LNNVYGVGFLGAQHLLSILTLLRVLQNPEYVILTKVLKNTTREKKLTTIYRLTHKSINALNRELFFILSVGYSTIQVEGM